MNVAGHFKTITSHKLRVMKHCFACGLYKQGLLHDMSKYLPVEFIPGCKYYRGYRSPNEIERMEKGYSSAWLHHKGRNKHHLEYWIDYDPAGDHAMTGMRMPLRYVCEMVCDRVAASETYEKEKYTSASAWNYYNKSRGHYLMHPQTRAFLEFLLLKVRNEGQDAAFAYIRQLLRSEQDYGPHLWGTPLPEMTLLPPVTHEMKLDPGPFAMVQSGQKTVELRLWDEKRSRLQPGDVIVFTNTAGGGQLRAAVKQLHRFDTFEQLYRALPLLQCGYTAETVGSASPADMERYYSPEQQKKYGVVGIELCLLQADGTGL